MSDLMINKLMWKICRLLALMALVMTVATSSAVADEPEEPGPTPAPCDMTVSPASATVAVGNFVTIESRSPNYNFLGASSNRPEIAKVYARPGGGGARRLAVDVWGQAASASNVTITFTAEGGCRITASVKVVKGGVAFATYLVTGGGSWSFGGGIGSSKGWDLRNYPNASGRYPERQRYDYGYFWANAASRAEETFNIDELESSDINRCGTGPGGVVRHTAVCVITPPSGTLTINRRVNTGANKWVAFFVGDPASPGRVIDLVINQDVDIHDRSGVMFFVNGNVRVKSTVRQLDGAYLANGNFIMPYDASVKGTAVEVQLTGAGYWWTYGGFDMRTFRRRVDPGERDPGEILEFDPKYIVNFTPLVGGPSYTWQEIVP